MEERTIQKFAWFPLRVKILNVEESRFVFIWMSKYFEKQVFKIVSDKAKNIEWGWVSVIKYLHSFN